MRALDGDPSREPEALEREPLAGLLGTRKVSVGISKLMVVM